VLAVGQEFVEPEDGLDVEPDLIRVETAAALRTEAAAVKQADGVLAGVDYPSLATTLA